MNELERTQKLKEFQHKHDPVSKERIPYKGETKELEAYDIPIEYLVLNQHNGRIGTRVTTYERNNKKIDASTEEGEQLLMRFLWESNVRQNISTYKNLKLNQQLRSGIVTKDGVVIDGNRRYMLIKKRAQEEHMNPAYFRAVILDDSVNDNQKEIRKLETIFQIGADQPLNYNPIEKYLKCKHLSEEDGFSDDEIAIMMNEKASKIKEYRLIFDLMEEYLEYYGYEGIYTRLEKCEGPLVNLQSYLDSHIKGKYANKDWNPKNDEIDDLKLVCFDYIRAGYLAQSGFRDIGRPTKGDSFFNHEDLWSKFRERHNAVDEISKDETSLVDLLKENPEADIDKLIDSKDCDWQEEVDSYLKRNMGIAKSKLEDIHEADHPSLLLQRAIDTLTTIKEETINKIDMKKEFKTARAIKVDSHQIRKLAEKFIKIIEKKEKGKQ